MLGPGLTSLVATVYEAACDPSRIAPFVEDAAEYFGAQRAAFVVWPVNNPDAFVTVGHGISSQHLLTLFQDRNDPDSLFWRLAQERPGSIFVSEAPLAAGSDAQILAGLVDAGDENRCGLVLMRESEHESFSASEREALETLIGYFSRSLLINKRFVRLFAQNKTALSLLEYSPRGIAIFGQRGQLTFQNAEARRIFSDSDTFHLRDDALQIHNEQIHGQLYDFLQLARDSYDAGMGEQRLSTRIYRGPEKSPFQMSVYGLPFKPARAALDEHESLAVMLIHDPTTLTALDVDLLQDFYGFTGAEANLAHTLHHGVSLSEAAAQLRISVNTARTQLRSMFKKARVNSQAALLQEFCTSPILNIHP